MKKIIPYILFIIAIIIIIFSFQIQYWQSVCCACYNGWTVGSGIVQEISRSQEQYMGACNCDLLGCALSKRIIPVDYLIISVGLIWYGVYLLRKKFDTMVNKPKEE